MNNISVLLIDNYDSFTYNILSYLVTLGVRVIVKRNDQTSIDQIVNQIRPDLIVISPGPCTPNESGVSLEIISNFQMINVPILGICLGHQAIAQVFGGRIIQNVKPMHAKVSEIKHYGNKMFINIPRKFRVARYHSLIIEKYTIPDCLLVTAMSVDDEVIMAIAHREYPIYGVQFHPESIASEYGHQILQNFLHTAARRLIQNN